MARSDEIRERLMSDIAGGVFASGQRITIDDLAQRYGTSHMPVREVLHELQGSGVLRQGPGRSMQLAELNRASIDALFATRGAVEVMLTRQAAQRCTRVELAGLHAIQAELEHAVDTGADDAVLAANQRFHTALYALAENPEANVIVERHWLFIRILWARVGFGAARYAGVVNDHRHILTALAAHDVEAAGLLMGAHVIKAKYELMSRLAGLPRSGM